jgi:hypothetical protein
MSRLDHHNTKLKIKKILTVKKATFIVVLACTRSFQGLDTVNKCTDNIEAVAICLPEKI